MEEFRVCIEKIPFPVYHVWVSRSHAKTCNNLLMHIVSLSTYFLQLSLHDMQNFVVSCLPFLSTAEYDDSSASLLLKILSFVYSPAIVNILSTPRLSISVQKQATRCLNKLSTAAAKQSENAAQSAS